MITHQDRFFINPPGEGETAAVVFNIYADDERPEVVESYDLGITDCYKRITIHGGLRNKKAVETAITKIRNLREGFERIEKILSEINT